MGKINLNYKFNNPNSAEDTAEMLLKLFVKANSEKVERAIKSATECGENKISHSA